MTDEQEPAARTRLPRSERRAQLIRLGLQMLATRTIDEISVDDIAVAAGISRGLLFHYFSSKIDFQVAVVRAAAAELIDVTRPDAWLDPGAQFDQGMRAYIRYMRDNRSAYLSLVRGAASANAEMQAVFDTTRTVFGDRVIDSWVEMGVAVTPLQRIAIRGWVGFVEDCVLTWLTDFEHDVDETEVLKLVSNHVVQILQTPTLVEDGIT